MAVKKRWGYFCALIAIFLWSWNVVISRYLSDAVPPIQISFFRWLIAGAFITPFTIHEIYLCRHILLKNIKIILIISLGLAFMNNFIYLAGKSISAVDMSLLGTSGPIFFIFLSSFIFKNHLSVRQLSGFIIALLGVIWVISDGNINYLINFDFKAGDFWMLAYALFFSIYGLAQRKRPMEISQLGFFSVAIIIGLLMILPFFIASLPKFPLSNIDKTGWAIFAFLGIVNSVIGYLAWNLALDKLGNFEANLFYYTMPLFSCLEAYLFLGEQLYPAQVWGAGIVIFGIYFAATHNHNPPRIVRP